MKVRRNKSKNAKADNPVFSTNAASRKQAIEAGCWLCGRELARQVEWHHPVPKSRGGVATVPVHPICHRTLHASFTNHELERFGEDISSLRATPQMTKFLRWIVGKPPSFHAPTRKRKR